MTEDEEIKMLREDRARAREMHLVSKRTRKVQALITPPDGPQRYAEYVGRAPKLIAKNVLHLQELAETLAATADFYTATDLTERFFIEVVVRGGEEAVGAIALDLLIRCIQNEKRPTDFPEPLVVARASQVLARAKRDPILALGEFVASLQQGDIEEMVRDYLRYGGTDENLLLVGSLYLRDD